MIMPAGAGGHMERYANMEESEVNYGGGKPWLKSQMKIVV